MKGIKMPNARNLPDRILLASILILVVGITNRALAESEWWPWRPDDDTGPSAIDMTGWLDKPAGCHGFLKIDNDRFLFEDGTPIKFWGTNHGNKGCAPDKETADFRAARYAKYGLNLIRLHKFTWHGNRAGIGHKDDSTKTEPAGQDRLDYYCARLRDKGIYFGWSHIYGHRLRPGDRGKVLAYDEVVNAGSAHLKGSSIGLVMFADDLQALNIQLTVNMLNHTNPYTHKRYADDPALAFIELQNEDDIFFPTTHQMVMQCPTYKKVFCELFSDWLKRKYGSQEKLVAAWGQRVLNAYPKFQTDESLDKRNIYPIAHAWYLGEGVQQEQKNKGTGKRLLDTARFLYETQNRFYSKFAKAIRGTGYQGPIVGSCWQAGSGIPHYYNLYSDALVGIIDRHNYFGGGTGHSLKPGRVNNASMLARPGSGLLSTGFQQVANRPFQISEWLSKLPNEWIAEGSPIIAVYGLGLNGWDGSCEFASRGKFTDKIAMPNVYNIDVPTQIGLYPSLARMVYRGDVTQGKISYAKKVHIPSLLDGRLGFTDTVAQSGDNKIFKGQTPDEVLALAAGRVVVDFTDKFKAATLPKLTGLVTDKTVISNTGQLKWNYDDKGYFTVDTPATKAVVGFAAGKTLKLGNVTITPQTDFAVILITAMEKDKTIADSRQILINAVGRAYNTDMKYNDDHTELLEVGQSPILLESIDADITIEKDGTPTIYPLDNDGRKTNTTIPIIDGTFSINGSKYKTIYYLLTYD